MTGKLHRPAYRRGHSLVEAMAVIGVISFIMWMIVGVFAMSADIQRSVKNETDAIKATSRLSREFRKDVHAAVRITWSEGTIIREFKPAQDRAAIGYIVPPTSVDTSGRIMPPALSRGADSAATGEEKFDSPPEPEALTEAEKVAAKEKKTSAARRATHLKLTMLSGDSIHYTTTSAGLERRELDAKGNLLRRNVMRLAPAAFATLKLEETNSRKLAVLLLNYPIPKSHRHRDELSAARQLRIEATPFQMEAP